MAQPVEEKFLSPRFVGPRFESAQLPIESLVELIELRKLIIDVAKDNFLERNPERTRVKRNFKAGLELKLTGIEPGSCIPQITLVAVATGLPISNNDFVPCLEEARDQIARVIAMAENEEPIDPQFPIKRLKSFEKIGRTLRDHESIQIAVGNDRAKQPVGTLSKASRRRLLEHSGSTAIPQEIELRALVCEVDSEKHTCTLKMTDDSRVNCPAPRSLHEDFLVALNGFPSELPVMITGVGLVDANETVKKVQEVHSIEVLEVRDVEFRLQRLLELKEGWLDGQGAALDRDKANSFKTQFLRHFPDKLQLPVIFPTLDGGLSLEWHWGDENEITLEVDLSTQRATMTVFAEGRDTDHDFDLTIEEAWTEAVSILENHLGDSHE